MIQIIGEYCLGRVIIIIFIVHHSLRLPTYQIRIIQINNYYQIRIIQINNYYQIRIIQINNYYQIRIIQINNYYQIRIIQINNYYQIRIIQINNYYQIRIIHIEHKRCGCPLHLVRENFKTRLVSEANEESAHIGPSHRKSANDEFAESIQEKKFSKLLSIKFQSLFWMQIWSIRIFACSEYVNSRLER